MLFLLLVILMTNVTNASQTDILYVPNGEGKAKPYNVNILDTLYHCLQRLSNGRGGESEALVLAVASESCFYQRCLGCYQHEIIGPGSRQECHPSNWVTAEWMHNMGHAPPTTDSKVPIEYRCLKMVATPDEKSFGNTVDIIRGCVPRLQIDSVCASLAAVERARGHSDVRCHICRYNDCNSSVRTSLPSYIIFASFLLFYFLR